MTYYGVDCSQHLTYEDCLALKAAGKTHVFRYLGTGSKAITAQEVADIHRAGLILILVWESLPTKASYFTKAQGIADARAAYNRAKALSVPPNTVIIFAVDFDAQSKDMVAIDAYYDGIQNALSQYLDGAYGGYEVLFHLQQRAHPPEFFWQTYGWSGTKKLRIVDAYQYKNGVTISGIQVDLDEVYTNKGSWKGATSVATHPTLYRGIKNQVAAVRTLQMLLNAHGEKLKADGIFGPATQAAVIDFQKKEHAKDPKFSVDGIVGPQTWAALTAHEATNPPPPVTPPTPAPISHKYSLKAGWAGPAGKNITSATVGETLDFWVITLEDGKPVATTDPKNKMSSPYVHLSDGEDGPVPTFLPNGDGGVPWGTSTPGEYTMTARWNAPDGTVVYAPPVTITITSKTGSVPTAPASKHPVLATFPLTIENDAFLFNLTLDGNKEISPIQLDTGAFAIMLDTVTATALGLKNTGSITVGGVGGTVAAWSTSIPVKFGDKVYNMYAVVDPQWNAAQDGSHGLFGMRDVISNHLGIDVDTLAARFEVYDAAQ